MGIEVRCVVLLCLYTSISSVRLTVARAAHARRCASSRAYPAGFNEEAAGDPGRVECGAGRRDGSERCVCADWDGVQHDHHRVCVSPDRPEVRLSSWLPPPFKAEWPIWIAISIPSHTKCAMCWNDVWRRNQLQRRLRSSCQSSRLS